MASSQNRFLQLEQPPAPKRKRWVSCLGGLSCFGKQKGGTRIVPASRMPKSSTISNQPNGPNQIPSSLLAPPSSPASFSNSAIQSTSQSPSCFLSANSPENPSFVTGPYAHETQLVSPPVFSTFTTEPSTAPLTPPNLTTPSSPDVPYAHFLSKTPNVCKSNQGSNFFCPETFAQFYLDQSFFSNSGGRLSISKECEAYSNGYQNRQVKADAEELEAYRASFGFSADEIITTTNYVDIPDVLDDSFSITPFSSSEHSYTPSRIEGAETEKRQDLFPSLQLYRSSSMHSGAPTSYNDQVPKRRAGDTGRSFQNSQTLSDDDEDVFSKMGASRSNRRYQFGSSNSDAEIEYRRGSSLREGRYW